MAVRRSRAQWSEMLSRFEASGEPMARFCARHRLSPGTFAWWRWRLRDEQPDGAERGEVRLVAVDIPTAPAADAASTIRIGLGALDVHVEVGTDVAYVAALVDALRSRC
jgi:hypothetical protein